MSVLDATTGKDVLETEWHVGATAFTADSSRVLVVDDTARFRWFKLPPAKLDAKPETEWSFDLKANGFNARDVSVSADGSAVLYYGTPPGKAESYHLLDGKDGKVLFSFPAKRYLGFFGSVSDDGRHVMLLRNDGSGPTHTVEILDARGKSVHAIKASKEAGSTINAARISWKSRTLVVQERNGAKLTVYDLPELKAATP